MESVVLSKLGNTKLINSMKLFNFVGKIVYEISSKLNGMEQGNAHPFRSICNKKINLHEAAPTSSPNITHSSWMHGTLINAMFTSSIG